MNKVNLHSIVACPRCHSELDLGHTPLIKCTRCSFVGEEFDNKYNLLFGTKEKIKDIVQRFNYIHKAINKNYSRFITYLTLGYLPDGSERFAFLEPPKFCFNKYSTNLLLEVIGDYNFNGKKFIEIGSGRGGNIETINHYYRPEFTLGIDLSPENINFCSERYSIPNAFFLLGNAEALPMKNMFYDVVLNLESSHYYSNITQFYKEVYRILKSGGTLLYADIFTRDIFEDNIKDLAKIGFEIQRNQDISSNVLLSCKEIASLKDLQSSSALYKTFTVVPGNEIYEGLKIGKIQYKILTLRKK